MEDNNIKRHEEVREMYNNSIKVLIDPVENMFQDYYKSFINYLSLYVAGGFVLTFQDTGIEISRITSIRILLLVSLVLIFITVLYEMYFHFLLRDYIHRLLLKNNENNFSPDSDNGLDTKKLYSAVLVLYDNYMPAHHLISGLLRYDFVMPRCIILSLSGFFSAIILGVVEMFSSYSKYLICLSQPWIVFIVISIILYVIYKACDSKLEKSANEIKKVN